VQPRISSCRGLGPRAKQPLLVNRARSSAGEHLPDTEGVTGSIPVAPTSPFLQTNFSFGLSCGCARPRSGKRRSASTRRQGG
jgi:hypothetical protein